MDFSRKFFNLFLIFVLYNILNGEVSGTTISLDLKPTKGQFENRFNIACHYNEDYMDFWVYGCETEYKPDVDIFPEKRGFWTQCRPSRCDIIFDGQSLLLNSIAIDAYIKGEPQILVFGKESILGNFQSEPIAVIGDSLNSTTQDWFTTQIDLANHPTLKMFNISFTAPTGGFVLLDSISIEVLDSSTNKSCKVYFVRALFLAPLLAIMRWYIE